MEQEGPIAYIAVARTDKPINKRQRRDLLDGSIGSRNCLRTASSLQVLNADRYRIGMTELAVLIISLIVSLCVSLYVRLHACSHLRRSV